MDDLIIILILAAAIIIGVIYTVKHFKGKGSCCGGGGYKPKRKRIKNKIATKHFKVTGMHCAGCAARIEETVNDIDGLAGRVDLKSGILTVDYACESEDSGFMARIVQLGYGIEEM